METMWKKFIFAVLLGAACMHSEAGVVSSNVGKVEAEEQNLAKTGEETPKLELNDSDENEAEEEVTSMVDEIKRLKSDVEKRKKEEEDNKKKSKPGFFKEFFRGVGNMIVSPLRMTRDLIINPKRSVAVAGIGGSLQTMSKVAGAVTATEKKEKFKEAARDVWRGMTYDPERNKEMNELYEQHKKEHRDVKKIMDGEENEYDKQAMEEINKEIAKSDSFLPKENEDFEAKRERFIKHQEMLAKQHAQSTENSKGAGNKAMGMDGESSSSFPSFEQQITDFVKSGKDVGKFVKSEDEKLENQINGLKREKFLRGGILPDKKLQNEKKEKKKEEKERTLPDPKDPNAVKLFEAKKRRMERREQQRKIAIQKLGKPLPKFEDVIDKRTEGADTDISDQ